MISPVTAGLESDHLVLRAITDEIMYALMELSGQEYVDEYAQQAKNRLRSGRRPRRRPGGRTGTGGGAGPRGRAARRGRAPGDLRLGPGRRLPAAHSRPTPGRHGLHRRQAGGGAGSGATRAST